MTSMTNRMRRVVLAALAASGLAGGSAMAGELVPGGWFMPPPVAPAAPPQPAAEPAPPQPRVVAHPRPRHDERRKPVEHAPPSDGKIHF